MKYLDQEIRRIKEIMEGVGDKFAEKHFGIPNNIDSTPEPTSDTDVIVVDRGKNPIIKNPSDPKSIGDYTRGIIDKDGNLYLEKTFKDIHNRIIQYLIDANILKSKFSYDWVSLDPEQLGFITIQYIHGKIYIGASHKFRLLNDRELATFPSEMGKNKNLPKFQEFMTRAKMKNPNFTFVPELYDPNLNQ